MNRLPLIVAFLMLAACSGTSNGDPQENPSAAVPDNRLLDEGVAGNGAMSDTMSGATAVDPQAVGASAPGAATSGPAAAGQGTGGADGGRTLGDQ